MVNPSPIDLSIPYLTEGLEGIGGRIRDRPEDFMVEEVALYEPCGHGNHLYVNLTKRNQTTRDVQIGLAKLFKLRPQNIGTAGLKDKNAVTTQTFSALLQNRLGAGEASDLIESRLDVKVNWVGFHTNKLRAGHLIGNRFKITIMDLRMPLNQAVKKAWRVADVIHMRGVPNFYGVQRLGTTREKIRDGWAVLTGEKRVKDRWERKFLISVYQSYLCNRYLAERVNRGLFDGLLPGDIAKKHDTGGIFWVNDLATDQSRYLAQEISFTAPIYGYKMSKPLGESACLEAEILEESEMTMDVFKRGKITGTRRFGRLTPKIDIIETSRGLQLSFMLPKGGYATTILREFMKNK
jgi:tRNA pseudouridine13 synthase